MNMKLGLILFCLLCVKSGYTQIRVHTDTFVVYESISKYEFEKWNNHKTKKLKTGKGIEVTSVSYTHLRAHET